MSISGSSGKVRSACVRMSPAGTSTLRFSVKENKNWLLFEGIDLSFLSGFFNIKPLQRVILLSLKHSGCVWVGFCFCFGLLLGGVCFFFLVKFFHWL